MVKSYLSGTNFYVRVKGQYLHGDGKLYPGVTNPNTGSMDGWWASKRLAQAALDAYNKAHEPQYEWRVVWNRYRTTTIQGVDSLEQANKLCIDVLDCNKGYIRTHYASDLRIERRSIECGFESIWYTFKLI